MYKIRLTLSEFKANQINLVMKNIQNSTDYQKQSKSKQVQLFKNKPLNNTSVQKMKNLLAESILKKSNSLATIAPFMLNSMQNKGLIHHKTIAETKNSVSKLIQKPKSPKKTSLGSPKSKAIAQSIDLQEKRRRIYGMPYFFQINQPNHFSTNQQFNKHKLVSKIAENHNTPALETQRKMYTQTISTNYSVKEVSHLKIKDFQLGKILGYGKFGHVYTAKHKKSGFVYALKQIKRKGMDEILQNQLIRQIKIQMFINHPNIVKLYTFFFDSTHIYLVLQLCSSGQLYNFLKKNQPIKQDLAKVILRQICQGIDYIHENHIIHRDLKPQNILYHNSMLKICDFGWSVATPLMRDTFCGTPLYVSPQLLKKNYYNNKVDIWSIGILAYEILIGQVPFQIFCEADYIKILKNQVRFPKFMNISEQAKSFIGSCLQKDPEKRLTSNQLLEHPFLKKVELINFPQIY